MKSDPFYSREAQKYDVPIASREWILSYLEKIAKPVSLEQIAAEVKIEDKALIQALHRRLRAMERDGQVIFTRRQCYVLPDKLAMLKGQVIAHRDGYGFLRCEGVSDDYFLPNDQMKRVLHGDIILAQRIEQKYRGKSEARVIRILEPRKSLIVGRYFIEHGVGFVVPDDSRLNFDVLITEKPAQTVRMGAVVVVDLLQRPNYRQKAVGKIVEVLGDEVRTDVVVEMALRNHDIPFEFPQEVKQQVASLSEEVPQSAKRNRVDLRQLPLVTIDGEDARDFDDAVYCEPKRGGGWRLWVAIADVSYYVRPDSALDREANRRGTSVYFPSRVVPMLPEVLSNGLCSLNPQVDRLCMVCEMTISAKGRLSGYRFYEAVMNSHARLTYNKVFQILQGDSALREQYAPLVRHLEQLHQLYLVLDQSREQRGAIGFESAEPKFIFNADKRIERVDIAERNVAHKIIEECMILANVAAAKMVEKAEIPALYRVHEQPDSERINNLKNILQELGLSLKSRGETEPKAIAELMTQIAERPDHEMIQTLILRSMKQAVYDPENRGHFGLALQSYAHFTSPIRRYPDLLLHRALKWIIATSNKQRTATGGYCYDMQQMLYFGQQTSMTERRADEAVREVVDWLKCDFMQDHIGEVHQGVITSLTSFGFFVRLDELYIDGLVHVSALENDYYHYDADHHRLIGEASGLRYQLGDRVTVEVMAVNLDERKIDFALLSSQRKPKRSGKTAKQRERQAAKQTQAPRKPKGSRSQSRSTKRDEKSAAKPKSRRNRRNKQTK